MRIGWLLSLLALFLGGGDAAAQGLAVRSANGRFEAVVAKAPGQERVDDALARWLLSMVDLETGVELWSVHYRHDGAPARHFTSDDGSTFVRLKRDFSEAREVLRIDRWGERSVERTGREFSLQRDELERTNAGSLWLHEEGDTVDCGWVDTEHGPALMLTLESARGWTREVDVSMGRILFPFDYAEPHVMPGFPESSTPAEVLEIPYVNNVVVPRVGLAALPVRVEVSGSHATPNWSFFAFLMSWEDEQTIVLTPYSRPPTAGVATAQVLDRFKVDAYLQGLMPGSYRVAVAGPSSVEGVSMQYQSLEVLPGRIHVRLETTGGIAGIRDLTEIYKPGVLKVAKSRAPEGVQPEPRHLTPEEQSRLDLLVGALPAESSRKLSTSGSDFMQYRLGWWTGETWVEVTVDDGTSRGGVRKLIEFLRGL